MSFLLFAYSNKKEYIHDVMLLIQATSVNSSFVYSVVPSSLIPPTHTQPSTAHSNSFAQPASN